MKKSLISLFLAILLAAVALIYLGEIFALKFPSPLNFIIVILVILIRLFAAFELFAVYSRARQNLPTARFKSTLIAAILLSAVTLYFLIGVIYLFIYELTSPAARVSNFLTTNILALLVIALDATSTVVLFRAFFKARSAKDSRNLQDLPTKTPHSRDSEAKS